MYNYSNILLFVCLSTLCNFAFKVLHKYIIHYYYNIKLLHPHKHSLPG